jgi:hypothetical protein
MVGASSGSVGVADAVRAPSDFRYEEALARPGVRRARRAWKRVLGFDPCPPAEIVDAVLADMWTGDPVAERFVDEVMLAPQGDGPRAARNLLDRALAEGFDAIPDAPPAMAALFGEFEEPPQWVDPALVERGASIWRRWGTDLFRIAGAETLEMYTESAVAVPLSLAGGYAGENALRRFLETTRFWIDVSEPGALLRTGSAGRATAMRVRVMHVSVRRRVAEHGEWDSARWGLPISQAYMMLTLLGGSVTPALIGYLLGWRTSADEIRALMHHQRYLGWILGVQPRLYPRTIQEAIQVVFMTAIARTYTAGEHGAELIESFPQAFVPDPDLSAGERLRAEAERQLINGMVTMLMKPSTRRRHDMPPVLPGLLFPLARFPVIALRETVRQLVPGAEERLDARSRRRREAWYRRQMAGREAAFDASGALRR